MTDYITEVPDERVPCDHYDECGNHTTPEKAYADWFVQAGGESATLCNDCNQQP